MKAVVAAFNQEKALVGAFSVIVQLHRLIDLRHYSKDFPATAAAADQCFRLASAFPRPGLGRPPPAASHRQGQTASAATLLLCGDLCPTAETTGSVPAPPPAPGPWVCDQGVGTSASVRGWAPQPDSSDTIINTSTTTSTNQSHTGVRHQTGDESMEDDMTI